jgi:hypothetical protein
MSWASGGGWFDVEKRKGSERDQEQDKDADDAGEQLAYDSSHYQDSRPKTGGDSAKLWDSLHGGAPKGGGSLDKGGWEKALRQPLTDEEFAKLNHPSMTAGPEDGRVYSEKQYSGFDDDAEFRAKSDGEVAGKFAKASMSKGDDARMSGFDYSEGVDRHADESRVASQLAMTKTPRVTDSRMDSRMSGFDDADMAPPWVQAAMGKPDAAPELAGRDAGGVERKFKSLDEFEQYNYKHPGDFAGREAEFRGRGGAGYKPPQFGKSAASVTLGDGSRHRITRAEDYDDPRLGLSPEKIAEGKAHMASQEPEDLTNWTPSASEYAGKDLGGDAAISRSTASQIVAANAKRPAKRKS